MKTLNKPATHSRQTVIHDRTTPVECEKLKKCRPVFAKRTFLSVNTEIQVEVSLWRRGARKKHNINIIQECVKLSRP